MMQQQQRNNQNMNGYNQMFQPMQTQNAPMQQNFSVRVVTGQEEAMASATPLDGSISILIDRTNNMIYTKQLDFNNGSALINSFKKIDMPVKATNVENSVEYVKKSEFDELKLRFDEVWNALTAKPAETKTETKTTKKEGK